MGQREPVLFCWSGGKDSAMALYALLQDPQVKVVALLTTVTEGYERVSMHGVRRELLRRQAESIGLPLHEVLIPPECVNSIYEAPWKRRCGNILKLGLARSRSAIFFWKIYALTGSRTSRVSV